MPPNGGRLKEEKGCGVQGTCRSDGSAKKFRPDESGQRRWHAESEGGSGTRETPGARRPGGRPVPYVGAGSGITPSAAHDTPLEARQPEEREGEGGRAPRCGPAGRPGFEYRPGSGDAARARADEPATAARAAWRRRRPCSQDRLATRAEVAMRPGAAAAAAAAMPRSMPLRPSRSAATKKPRRQAAAGAAA